MTAYVAIIPWDADTFGPTTDEIAETAVGKPVHLGVRGDQVGTITKATAEHDPERLCLIYEIDTDKPGSLTVEALLCQDDDLGFAIINGGTFLPRPWLVE